MRRLMHEFAPLKNAPGSKHASASEGLKLEGIVFDMDGTLCKPQNYMFGEMRRALGISKAIDIIDHIESLPSAEQSVAWHKIETIESEAMVKQEVQPGLVGLLEYLDSKQIRRAICTRNFDKPVAHFLDNHVPGHLTPFSPVLTRSFKPPKPSPAGILHIADAWNVKEKDQRIPILMVGDSIDDLVAGREAGALTVLLASEGKEELRKDTNTDVVIDKLDDLIHLLEEGISSRTA